MRIKNAISRLVRIFKSFEEVETTVARNSRAVRKVHKHSLDSHVAALKLHVRDVRDVAVLKVIYKTYAMLLSECLEELSALPLVIIIALLLFL